MATAWLQRHDFSTEELGELTKTEMVTAFRGLDWAAELARSNDSDADQTWPPGFGINQGANILHLCPFDARHMFFHLHYEGDAKFLGVFPTRKKRSHYVENHPLQSAHIVISDFMDNNFAPILGIR